jgi:type IV secretory pathway VirB10-like protein
MEELMEEMVETLTGSPVRLAITISTLSLILMNIMWWATTRKHDRNLEQHFGSMIGVVAVAVLIVFGIDRVQHMGDAAADTDKQPQKMIAIEASIAKKTSPQKQPEKQFRAPEPDPPKQGVAKDPDKLPPPKKDKPPPPKKNTNDPKPIKPPDRTGDLDAPVGPVKDPVGPPSDNKRGFASVTKGDPFFQNLAADINENFEYPRALETKQLANGCFYFNLDGTVAGWKLLPKSGDETLDDAVERTLKKVEKIRKTNPVAVPQHLQEQATTSWTCFQLGNLQRQE